MRHRLTEILPSQGIDTAGTEVISLNVNTPISRITVQVKATNNNSVPTAHPAKIVSKIELVDGSDVLYSLSGVEAQALNFYESGKLPHTVLEYRNDVMCIATFHLNFGKKLWDKQLALLPSRFSNLQLRITHNKASGGSTPDAGYLSVFADIWDANDISPRGFLMSKEIYAYALVSSAQERIDLPVDFDYTKIVINSLAGGKNPHEQYNKVKLTIDNDRKVPINNLSTSDLMKLVQNFSRIVESLEGIATGSGVDHFCTVAYDVYANITNMDAALTNNYVPQDYGGTLSIVGDSNEHFQCNVQGVAPHGSLCLPFDGEDESDSLLRVGDIGDLELILTAGSSVLGSSTAEIVIQQVRNY